MKVMDSAQQAAPTNEVGKALAQAQGAFNKLIGTSAEAQGQETLINYLSRQLNNRYIMMRNVKLEGIEIIIPMILLGPTGINVISTWAEKGIYQIKAEAIAKMGNSKEYVPIRPSPVNRTLLMADAVTRYLRDHNIEPPEVQPVMFFSNAGTHIESARPSIRLVQIDGLERFTSTLLHGQVVLAPEDVHTLITTFTRSTAPVEAVESLPKQPAKIPGADLEPKLTQSLDRAGRKFSLSTRQWILIGAMALFEVCILIAFIFIILYTSRTPGL
jgi:hypothetical protein